MRQVKPLIRSKRLVSSFICTNLLFYLLWKENTGNLLPFSHAPTAFPLSFLPTLARPQCTIQMSAEKTELSVSITHQVLWAVLHFTLVENMEKLGYLYFFILHQETHLLGLLGWINWLLVALFTMNLLVYCKLRLLCMHRFRSWVRMVTYVPHKNLPRIFHLKFYLGYIKESFAWVRLIFTSPPCFIKVLLCWNNRALWKEKEKKITALI